MARRKERLGTVVLTALIVGGIAVPAHADEPPGAGIKAVPGGGATPVTYGESALLPSGRFAMPQVLAVTPLLSLQAQVEAAKVEAETLSERINELTEEHDKTRVAVAWAEYAWSLSDAELKKAQAAAASAATDAYKSANQLPPPFQSGDHLRDIQLLQPPQPETFNESTAFELQRATEAEQKAALELEAAKQAEKVAADKLATTTTAYQQRKKAQDLLEKRLVVLKSEEERRREREEGKIPDGYDPGESNEGLVAHPKAQKAVLFALKQVGKPYKFSEEGPDYFDCSGLTWRAYRNQGVSLRRVSKDQYYQTRHKPVELDALLPGDLLFYASDKTDWRTIHHVMLYMGNGKVVHATGSGDRVKISRINLGAGSPVDFATRLVDAVPVTPPTTEQS